MKQSSPFYLKVNPKQSAKTSQDKKEGEDHSDINLFASGKGISTNKYSTKNANLKTQNMPIIITDSLNRQSNSGGDDQTREQENFHTTTHNEGEKTLTLRSRLVPNKWPKHSLFLYRVKRKTNMLCTFIARGGCLFHTENDSKTYAGTLHQ